MPIINTRSSFSTLHISVESFTALIMRALVAASVLVVIASRHAAGDDSPPPIATDRPAVTDSSVVVPLGSLQVENGFAADLLQNADRRIW